MKTVKESIFLLTSTPYRDSDLVVNLLSAVNGKLSAVIYKGRKIGTAGSFLFQPGDLLDVEYQIRENNDFIRVINIAGNCTLNTADFSYDRFLFHSYLMELISRISQPGDHAADLHAILMENNQLKWIKADSLFLIGRYIWLLAHHGGYGVDYHNCINCLQSSWQYNETHDAVFRKEQYRFQTDSGTLLCSRCVPVVEQEDLITPAMLKVMWLMENHEKEGGPVPSVPAPVMIDVIKCLNRYLLQRYELRLKSLPLFLDSLTKLA